jgi:hypothetical protein
LFDEEYILNENEVLEGNDDDAKIKAGINLLNFKPELVHE